MVSKILHVTFLFFLMMIIAVRGQNPDIGRIFIGRQGNRSDPTEYTFNSNINNVQQNLPFSAVVFSGADGSETSKNEDIEVTCESAEAGEPGYTQVSFSRVNLPAAVPEGSVPFTFSVTGVGRAASVRCYGTSNAAGTVCPATADPSIVQPQFCRETSMSDPVAITLTPAPVVSICQPVNIVPRFSTLTYSGTFDVVLSETVRGSSVTVSCQSVDPTTLTYCQQPGVTCCTLSNAATFPSSVTVREGQKTATMSYNIGQSQKICFGVTCEAVSTGPLPEGYAQYVQSTSSDSSSEGLFESFAPEVYMEPQYLTVYNTSFQSLLYVDVNTDINVPFQCQALVANSLEEAMQRTVNIDCSFIVDTATTPATAATAPPTTTPVPTTTDVNATTGDSTLPTTTQPPIDLSSPWNTLDNTFVVSESEKFYTVRTSRALAVIAPVQEIVVTTCCSTVTNTASSYSNLRVATIAVANVEPDRNNTGGVTSGQADSERFVVNPAYREVAPCPCDLTFQACDINCCCDSECTDAEKQTFSGCIPGPLGGQDPGPDLRNCKSGHFPKDDWFPMMCVQFESNALLGQFYQNTDKLTTLTQITDLESQTSNVYTYRETEPRFSDLTEVNGYRDGSNILTITSQGRAGNLLLPQRATSGQCLDSTPVQFLRNSDSTCNHILTQETCTDLTAFSARVYAQPSSLFNPACPRSYSISSSGSIDASQSVNVQVNYHCAVNIAPYVKSTSVSFSDLVSPQTVYSFRPGLENLNCTDLCGADSSCLDYNQGFTGSESPALPPRCANDNSFELPSTPTYNTAQSRCDNVVLETRYRFTWAGQAITGLTVDMVLGNVPVVSGSQASISQKFSAVFTHDYSGSSNQSDNFQNTTAAYQRSGKPGYDYGKPVNSGCKTVNETTGATLPVDRSEISQMAVWQPGTDSLCRNTRRRLLTFGDNMQSSCVLRLATNDIQNCDSLKQLMLKQLNVLMPASVIGRYGYNSPNIEDMWIDVIREDPLPAVGEDTTAAPTTEATTSATVSEQNITVDPLSTQGGICHNIVSGVHLQILYAVTGQNRQYPLREVIGASVRYTVSDWSMSCVGPNLVRCENNSAFTQPFLVHSSVQYTPVSATTPQKSIMFYQMYNKEKCDSDSCYRFYEDFDKSVCHFDTCWHELFYPLTKEYQGYESVNYTRGFSLLFCLFIVGYLSVAKPWR